MIKEKEKWQMQMDDDFIFIFLKNKHSKSYQLHHPQLFLPLVQSSEKGFQTGKHITKNLKNESKLLLLYKSTQEILIQQYLQLLHASKYFFHEY